MNVQDLTMDIEQQVEINAKIDDVFENLLKRLSDENTNSGDDPMPMCLERWPGGRWFRDLGNHNGHLWGFVQVIKPPTVLELCGPMFMSYAVAGHLSIRLNETAGTTRLSLRHRAVGLIEKEHREGVAMGWGHYMKSVKRDCEQ